MNWRSKETHMFWLPNFLTLLLETKRLRRPKCISEMYTSEFQLRLKKDGFLNNQVKNMYDQHYKAVIVIQVGYLYEIFLSKIKKKPVITKTFGGENCMLENKTVWNVLKYLPCTTEIFTVQYKHLLLRHWSKYKRICYIFFADFFVKTWVCSKAIYQFTDVISVSFVLQEEINFCPNLPELLLKVS